MSPHTTELVSGAVCYGTALLIAASVALRARRSYRGARTYPEVAARYAAERQAERDRDDAGWRRLMDAVWYADGEPVPPECDPLIVTNPETPQQGDEAR